MKKSVKKIVKALPGPFSYCRCKSPCSPQEVDHILPVRVLREKLSGDKYKLALNDPHNLHNCCSKLNRTKSDLVFGEKTIGDCFSGILSRACLYMNYTYKLDMGPELIDTWKWKSLLNKPYSFEYERDFIIFKHTKNRNRFIYGFPTSSLRLK